MIARRPLRLRIKAGDIGGVVSSSKGPKTGVWVIATGNGSDSPLAPVNGKFVVLRAPYPLGFFAKGMDGRIDDPKTGWKGKGVWTTWGTHTPYHSGTGQGTNAKVVHFQIRPDPLAD